MSFKAVNNIIYNTMYIVFFFFFFEIEFQPMVSAFNENYLLSD